MRYSNSHNALPTLGLSAAVDVFDDEDLFRTLNNDDVLNLSRLGGRTGFSSAKAIHRSTGISRRRVLNHHVRPIDLALAMCDRLREVTGMRLADYDHILLCHSHTDPTACDRLAARLSTALGLTAGRITAFNHGCTGFLKLVTEGSLLLEESPIGAKAALISVETPEFWHDAADRLFCGIVSAGATAGVLEVGHGLPVGVVRSDDFRIPMERRPNPDVLFAKDTTDVFDFDGQPCHRTVMRMNAEPVFLNGIELMLDNLRSALLGIEPADGERIVVAPHQPSGKLLKALIAVAGNEFPTLEFLNNLESYGNTISSSVPTLVARLDEVLEHNQLPPLRDGDHLILLAAGICMDEMANHMSAGHTCLRWKNGVLNCPVAQPAVVNAGSATA
ncbi:MAG: hypothetical protein R3C59_03550 [Planctomycetaceae bacterium]